MKEKFQKLARVILAVAAFVLVFAAKGTIVEASSYRQTAQTQTSVSFSWDTNLPKNLTGVYIGYSDNYDQAKANALAHQITIPSTTKSYTLQGLKPGTLYYVYVSYAYRYQEYKTKKWVNTVSNISCNLRTTPGTVTGLNQRDWYRLILDVDVEWDRQTGADGYEYKFMDNSGRVLTHTTTTGTTFRHKIKNTEVYTGTVRAYSTINGVKYYSEWCPTAYFMTQPARGPIRGNDRRELDLKISGNKLKVSWAKVNGIDKYNVYVATKKGGAFKKVKTVNKNKKSVTVAKVGGKKIKRNKKYYVYVEGVKIVNGRQYTTGINYITPINDRKAGDVIYVSSWGK